MDTLPIISPTEITNEKPPLILVVDDNEANRDSLSRRLTRHGYTAITAADGPSALALIEQQTFDLLLLDIMMPGMSGLEVLAHIRKHRSHTDLPIIMATAQDESQDIVGALDSGANDYVTKPFEFTVVLARVRTQLLLKKAVNLAADLERRLSARNVDLEAANVELQRLARRAAFELEAAARVQKTFLPSPSLKTSGCSFAFAYEPCQELAGDSLNILQLDADHVALYILDVSGHGVAASLLAVAATRLLSEVSCGNSIVMQMKEGVMIPLSPSEVASILNKQFVSNPETAQYMTLFYAIFNARTQVLTYVSAGHPGAIHLSRGHNPRTLEGSNLPIGFGQEYEQHTVQLEPGDRVYLYSDGVTDARNPLDDLFGSERLSSALQNTLQTTLSMSVEALQRELATWQAGAAAKDDISVLAIECGLPRDRMNPAQI
jgi:sigma-B regulation protein RsbU (phosphoserine phosphatase)